MWNSNQSLEEMARRLAGSSRTLVLTHLKPDGDAVGSTLGMARALNLSGWSSTPRAHLWYYGPPPPWLAEMCGTTPFQHVSSSNPIEQALAAIGGEPDAILILDTGAWSQLEPVADFLASRREKIMCVDHHAQGDADLAPTRFVQVSAAAVCQPAAELARLVLRKDSIAQLPREVAEPFYLGLGTDTGWFRHSNVNPALMRDAASLLEAGADHVRLHAMTEQNTLGRVKLIGRAIASLELHCGDRLATMKVTRQDLLECEATPGDTGGITDFTQSLPNVRVSAMLTEALPGDFGRSGEAGVLTKISLRSKAIAPLVDVNAIAGKMNGGGHIRAAGARLEADIETTKAALVDLVSQQLKTLERDGSV
jgi:phosphoesterase RecJ-like protein